MRTRVYGRARPAAASQRPSSRCPFHLRRLSLCIALGLSITCLGPTLSGQAPTQPRKSPSAETVPKPVEGANPAFRAWCLDPSARAERSPPQELLAAWKAGWRPPASLSRNGAGLPAGRHRIALGAPQPARHLHLWVPQGAAPPDGWPLLVVAGLVGARSSLNAFVAERVAAGWMVLLPVEPDQERNFPRHRTPAILFQGRAPGHDASVLLDLSTRTALDRERIHFLSQLLIAPDGDLLPIAVHPVDPAPIAALMLLLPGAARITPPLHPPRWASRSLLVEHGPHIPDATRLEVLRARAQAKTRTGTQLITRTHPALTWAPELTLPTPPVGLDSDRFRRPPAPQALRWVRRQTGTHRCEWLHLLSPELLGTLEATRNAQGLSLRIRADEGPKRASLRIGLQHSPGPGWKLDVQGVIREHGLSAQPGPREALLAARWSLRSGRIVRRILEVSVPLDR